MAGVFFNGRRIITPTTASAVNDDAMRNQNLSVGNVLAVVGRSTGGKPKTELRFGSPQDAQKELVSGDLLDAVLAAFDPSSEVGGPDTVVAIRVNPAVQASGTIKSGATDVINLVSTGYGLRENQIKYKVEAGTNSGLRVSTQRGLTTFTQDNIGRSPFSVLYTGGQATATITVTGTSIVLAAPAGTTVATIDLNTFTTVQDVVDRINVVAGFSASVLGGFGATAALNGLDYVTAQSVKTLYSVKADLQAVVDWLNGLGEGLVTATRVAGVGLVPTAADWQYLTGGSDGTTLTQDWADAFAALQYVDVQWVVPASGDPALHAMADTHAAYMSTVGRKERRVVCGTVAGTTDAQAVAAAKLINSDRTSLVHLGHYEYNAAGQLALLPPYISAARVAGGFAGTNPGTPLTNKNFKCRGLERKLLVPTDTDVLLEGGVLPLIDTEEGYKVCQSISTWLTNDNYNRVEQSCGFALDFTARNIRNALDKLRGQKGHPLLLARAVSITESVLRELARAEPVGPGVLAGNTENPAYRNISASLEGDVLRVQFECCPVIPVNYVLATIYAVPFSGTATA